MLTDAEVEQQVLHAREQVKACAPKQRQENQLAERRFGETRPGRKGGKRVVREVEQRPHANEQDEAGDAMRNRGHRVERKMEAQQIQVHRSR